MQPVRSDPTAEAAEPSLATNAVLSWLTFAGRAGFAFVATMLVARVLGPSGRGEVTYVINIAALVALFLSAGTGAALVGLRVNGNWSEERLHAAAFGVSIVTGGVFALVASVGSVLAEGPQRTTLVVAAVVAIPLVATTNLNQTAGLSDRLGLVAWTSLAGFGLYALVTLITALAGSMTVRNNLSWWLVSSTVPALLLIWPGRLIRSIPSTVWADTRSLLASAWRMNVAAIAVLAIWRIDIVIIEHRRGFEELGQYSVAAGVAEVVVALSVGLRTAVLPHQALAGESRLADVLCIVTRVSFPAVLLLAGAVAAVGPWGLAAIFGADFRPAYPALVLLLPGVALLVLHYPLFDYVVARQGLRSLTIMGLVGVGFNIVLNMVLLQRYSFVVSSVVSSLSYGLVFVWCLVEFLRRSNKSVSDALLIRRADLRALRGQLARGGRTESRP